jgi:hypothetical protein
MTNEKSVSRRSVLKGAAVGGVGLAAGAGLLAGCSKKNTDPVTFTVRGTSECIHKEDWRKDHTASS